jgi:hypothetical protein
MCSNPLRGQYFFRTWLTFLYILLYISWRNLVILIKKKGDSYFETFEQFDHLRALLHGINI